MKVLKFGGTSVGSAQRMKGVAKLITGERNIVVLSAMSGTTNSLVEISDYLYKKNPDGANEVINKLAQKYYGHIEELYSTDEYKQKAKELIKHHFDHIRTFTKDLFTLFEEKVVLAQGELISTGMMNLYLNECGVNSVLIPALDYMRTDKNAEPDPVYIKEKLVKLLDEHKDADLFITQGYICRNAYGEIDNLQRGGSDYSASLIGAAIGAEEIQIWTDIDGMHNNDPRIVEKTSPVRHLHFEEAAELAYFGAKILHPTCILPAKLNNIPVRLLNTMQPEAPGTMISNMTEKGKTLAFQVSEELFQRVKEYLEAYEKAYHRRLTQKEFVIGLIEQALEEAEEEFEAARADEYEKQIEGCRESTADEDAEPDDIEETDESPEEETYA